MTNFNDQVLPVWSVFFFFLFMVYWLAIFVIAKSEVTLLSKQIYWQHQAVMTSGGFCVETEGEKGLCVN